MARPEHRPPTSDAGVCPPDQQHLRLFFHPPFVRQTRHHLDWTASKIWQQASITHLANKRQATAVGFETQPLQWTTDVSRPLFGNQIKTQPAVQGKNRTYHIQPWAMAAIISHPSSDDVHGKSSNAHHRRLRAGISDLGSEIQPTTSRSPNQKANSNSDPTATPRAERENSHRQVHHTQLHRAPAAPFAGHDSGVPIVSSHPGPRQQITSASEQNSVAQRAGKPRE